MNAAPARQRLDKWLWYARMARTRSAAARLVSEGAVRVNGVRADAPARAVKVGDVLTLALPHATRVVAIRDLGERRGPALEAAGLYDDIGGSGD
ncbi:RNA-binding S4 domain-containing protein [Chelatococcus reniformis]|uniref:RNA-binding protein S4 n=1 Tax=Chelatococcus reniformis TaxID=1494448 RepID=A0A916X851_9HYPH|nr:RNA-binding S4 domain-containing protein [Chelatococcus reniformis]GGC50508.1 RNA-binding protein S4 [Chelatococcus reniformis]